VALIPDPLYEYAGSEKGYARDVIPVVFSLSGRVTPAPKKA